MILRTLTKEDIPQLKKIWRDTFGDPMHFIDWYFDHRFFPDHSACACDGDQIVSVCHTMPTHINIRGKSIPCALLNGVATLPEYRGKGFMKQVITYLYEILSPMGFCLMPNTPADVRIYEPCGHYPSIPMAEIKRAEKRKMPEELFSGEILDNLPAMYTLYQRIAPSWSGMILRTEEEFSRKCSEHVLDDCKVLLHPGGYAIFFDNEETCTCTEFMAEDHASMEALIDGLFAHAYPKKLQGRFPAEAFPKEPAKTRSVLGIINTEQFLKSLNIDLPIVLKIRDDFYHKNSGTFLLNGTPSDAPPHAELSIGALAQWLSGYCNIDETDAVIHKDMPYPTKQRCFTNDDY